MSTQESSQPPSVLGDFVFAWGPATQAWVNGLRGDGFGVVSEPADLAQVPAPGSIFRDVRRHEPATCWSWRPGGAPRLERYYVPEYPEDGRDAEDTLARALTSRMVATVHDYRPSGLPDDGWGCFLSG